MDWYYSRMFKSQEAAREQNRREQRRLNLDMEEKRAGHRYNMETVRREQREIERELEKIRQGAHGSLVNVDIFSHHIRKSTRDHIINIVSPTMTHERRIAFKGPHKENTFTEKPSHSIDNHGIFDALFYLKHNPEAMNQNIKQSDSQSDRMAVKDVAHTYRHAPEFVSIVPSKLQKMSPDPSKHQPLTGTETMPTMTNVMLPNISKSTEMNVNLLNLRNFRSRLGSSDSSTMYKMPTSIQFESHSSQNRDDVLICIPENGVLISPSPRLKYPGFKIRDQECETVTETSHHLLSPVLPNFKVISYYTCRLNNKQYHFVT
ncbi:hypothetical protein ACJMK2_040154 [Sinanodonta woodiana]|uniref:Uncharacterized protein n=1 Tax=Sinanodonta woodiana TaxID=1069815 RepID=A0ABD3WFQ7_SINWO